MLHPLEHKELSASHQLLGWLALLDDAPDDQGVVLGVGHADDALCCQQGGNLDGVVHSAKARLVRPVQQKASAGTVAHDNRNRHSKQDSTCTKGAGLCLLTANTWHSPSAAGPAQLSLLAQTGMLAAVSSAAVQSPAFHELGHKTRTAGRATSCTSAAPPAQNGAVPAPDHMYHYVPHQAEQPKRQVPPCAVEPPVHCPCHSSSCWPRVYAMAPGH